MGKGFREAVMEDSDLKDFKDAGRKVEELVSAGKKAIRDATDFGNTLKAKPTQKKVASTPAPTLESPAVGGAEASSPTLAKSDVDEA